MNLIIGNGSKKYESEKSRIRLDWTHIADAISFPVGPGPFRKENFVSFTSLGIDFSILVRYTYAT